MQLFAQSSFCTHINGKSQFIQACQPVSVSNPPVDYSEDPHTCRSSVEELALYSGSEQRTGKRDNTHSKLLQKL